MRMLVPSARRSSAEPFGPVRMRSPGLIRLPVSAGIRWPSRRISTSPCIDARVGCSPPAGQINHRITNPTAANKARAGTAIANLGRRRHQADSSEARGGGLGERGAAGQLALHGLVQHRVGFGEFPETDAIRRRVEQAILEFAPFRIRHLATQMRVNQPIQTLVSHAGFLPRWVSMHSRRNFRARDKATLTAKGVQFMICAMAFGLCSSW